ncbi:MAG: phospho-sugar mutase [Myxococcales bacterium]|nr:MAG: phospho-sugar mutase [Myxococcales bacterium]
MSIIDKARSWIEQDPDPETRRELEVLIDRGDVAALEERFAGELQFGTAGLRGLLGAGPTRMNRVTVARVTAGLCTWLKQEVPEATSRGICVGRDARPNSDVFERDVVEIAAGAGIPVWTFGDVVPTPVLAFAILNLRAAGGVMITASHNPPGYNGYKVYWENGAQIIPPNDRGIADAIQRLSSAVEIPRLSIDQARANGLLRTADHLRDDYIQRIASEVSPNEDRGEVRIAYTALHGVAEDTFRKVLGRAGFEDVHSVSEQAAPDGSFPTVAFPNPEEPGAMDRVLTLARQVDADVAIANDPDGDRVAVAVRDEGFELLSGNDIGILLADDLLRRHRGAAKRVVISTVVSSPMLGPVAASHGARWEQTLTGHKWIQNRAIELEQEGFTYVFGYEEALGYAPSPAVRDKDGISSALLMIDMASRLKARGHTLLDAREALWRKHGFFADRQVSVGFEGADAHAQMNAAVDHFREQPPLKIGGQPVLRMLDLGRQVQWTPGGATSFTELAPSNTVIFELQGGHRAMVRPSGTEPKLKYYFYAFAPAVARVDFAESKKQALATLKRMVEDLIRSNDC